MDLTNTHHYKGSLCVWTDGSLKTIENHTQVCSAVWFGNNNQGNISFNTIGTQDVCNAELEAIEQAVSTVPESSNIIIFVDSKAAIDCFHNWNKWKLKTRNKSKYKNSLKRIHD